MGNADLQAYLASKYMTGAKADAILERQSSSSSSDPNSKKRKKRKVESTSSLPVASTSSGGNGFVIADQDEDSWSKVNEEETEEYKPGTSLLFLSYLLKVRADT